MINKRSWPDYGALLIVCLILALIPLATGGSPYYLRLATLMLVYMTYAVAFNIIFGHTRQLFLCMGALAGCSGYLSVVLIRELGLPPGVTMPLGVLFASSLGAVFSYASVRRGLGVIFVGVITIAFTLVFHNVILGLRVLTSGEDGIVTRGLGFGVLEHRLASYYILLAILLLSLLLYHFLISSRIGLAFRALNDNELTAELAGIDVTRYKVFAAFIGSALFGIAGAFYAQYNGFISPDIFSFVSVDTLVFIMVLLGGMGTLLGPIIGAGVFTIVNELVRPLGYLNLLVYGVSLIVLFLLFREGLVVTLRKMVKLHIP